VFLWQAGQGVKMSVIQVSDAVAAQDQGMQFFQIF